MKDNTPTHQAKGNAPVYVDQMGNTLMLPVFPPRRIVSLVPSQTELLHALGLGDTVVGISKFCIRPDEWYASKNHVGGTKTLNLEKIKDLAPCLIIGNREENEKSQIETLQQQYPVWMSDISTLEDAYRMITAIGRITDTETKANDMVQTMQFRFEQYKKAIRHKPRLRAAYVDFAQTDPPKTLKLTPPGQPKT